MNSQTRRSFLRAAGSSFAILLVLARANLNAADLPVKGTFNVRDFGAVGDGTNLDSPAIDKAIAAAAAAGGGTVLVPAGTFLSSSIHLQSNIHLAEGEAPSKFENVSNTVIRNSPVLER